jgi:hypothetical protein
MEPNKDTAAEPFKIVDYLDLIPRKPDPNPKATQQLCDQIRNMLKDHEFPPVIPTNFKRFEEMIPKGGFKPGELVLFASTPRPSECKSNLVFHMALKRRAEDPNYKPVFHFENEWSAYDQERFETACKNMGLEITNDNKESKS